MLAAVAEGSTGFLIDGYPREEEQGVLFESLIRPCHVTIYYNASDDTMLARFARCYSAKEIGYWVVVEIIIQSTSVNYHQSCLGHVCHGVFGMNGTFGAIGEPVICSF